MSSMVTDFGGNADVPRIPVMHSGVFESTVIGFRCEFHGDRSVRFHRVLLRV